LESLFTICIPLKVLPTFKDLEERQAFLSKLGEESIESYKARENQLTRLFSAFHGLMFHPLFDQSGANDRNPLGKLYSSQ